MSGLSKSKLIAFRQCPKRLWLEIHQADLRDDSASEAVFMTGNQVGDVARRIYDPEETGVTVDIATLGHSAALALSAELLREGRGPVFEAGVSVGGALAYADVMLPERSDGTLRWNMIEVKSSTKLKDYHLDDIAVQSYLAVTSGVPLAAVIVAHVDKRFIYPGDGDYRGLLKENDLTQEALSRSDEVRQWIADAQAVAALPEEPVVATGPQCGSPFACGFCEYCNRDLVVGPTPEYPLSSIPNFHWRKHELMEELGIEDLRDVPDEYLSDRQAFVKEHTVAGTVFFDAAGAAADLAPHGFPAYFLDFETIRLAVPIWKGTRPYRQIPFQFSLHILAEDGTLQHTCFLDLSGNDPSREFALSLIAQCGEHGPVFVYNATFENGVMGKLAAQYPDLAPALEAIIERVVDLLPVARNRYYHPSQHGKWSIKNVLPAAVPELSYDQLEGVQDGMAAGAAFLEAIAPATTPERKREIEGQLIEYCKLDTLAMVRLWGVFAGKAR
jgi:hypothetical protein